MSDYLLLPARTFDEDVSGASYALVEMTPGRIESLLCRMAVARYVSEVDGGDGGFLSLGFWDSDVEWIAWSEELEEVLGDARDGGFVVLDERPEVPGEQLAECECGTLVVYTHEVFWKALVKHTNTPVESAWVTMKTLEELRG